MRLTEEDWYRLSVGERQALIDDLKSKIRKYKQYHDDVANWVSFGRVIPGIGLSGAFEYDALKPG
jgi:serine/threonine-protein kinase PpkA